MFNLFPSPISSGFSLWDLAVARKGGFCLQCVCVLIPNTPHVCTWGACGVSVHVCVARGMKVNTSVRALQTHPSVSTCVACVRVCA